MQGVDGLIKMNEVAIEIRIYYLHAEKIVTVRAGE